MRRTKTYSIVLAVIALFLSACQPREEKVSENSNTVESTGKITAKQINSENNRVTNAECQCSCPPAATPACNKPATQAAAKSSVENAPSFDPLVPTKWSAIDLTVYTVAESWPAWLQSCSALQDNSDWAAVCQKTKSLNNAYAGKPPKKLIQSFFVNNFNLFAVNNQQGDQGLTTGYYQPLLKGSRQQSVNYPFPLYSTPSDLVTVSLAAQFPSLEHQRVRGRLQGQKLIPYYTRADIDLPLSPIQNNALLYLNNEIDLFFLHIQGSGMVELDTGERIQVGYDNHNGHPYHSIGRVLIRRGDLAASQASMAGIKRWAKEHPNQLRALLNENPSYVFFRELPKGLPGPLGSLGVPLHAEQAIAVDKRYIPLGAPVLLSTTYPNSARKLNKLMMAQDTGGAIKGPVRADFYWGAGDQAGAKAGAMKQKSKMWVLLPKTIKQPNDN